VLEVAGPSGERSTKLLKSMGASWLLRRRLEQLPIVVVGRDYAVYKGNEQKFFFTPAALKHLLMEQRGSFARLELKRSDFRDRYIAIAWKRHVNNLIIVGGASGSGKSTFLNRLKQRQLPEIAKEMGIDTNDNWIFSDAVRIKDIPDGRIDNLIFHYDILRIFESDTYRYSREQGIDILDCAKNRKVVTLWCDPVVMYQRKEAKLRKHMRHWRKRRIKNVLALYENRDRLAQQYSKWLDYCRKKEAQLFFVDCTGEPSLLTDSQWNEKVGKLRGR
jgi:hypothetical protein